MRALPQLVYGADGEGGAIVSAMRAHGRRSQPSPRGRWRRPTTDCRALIQDFFQARPVAGRLTCRTARSVRLRAGGGIGRHGDVRRPAGDLSLRRANCRRLATVERWRRPPVPDLERRAFQVFDNGTCEITFFERRQPITVAIMLDMSGSMINRVIRVRESTGASSRRSRRTTARIGTFGAEVAISPVLTATRSAHPRASRGARPGGSPLWRAVIAAMTSLEGETGRRVIRAHRQATPTICQGGRA
jgi:hypothetical protein